MKVQGSSSKGFVTFFLICKGNVMALLNAYEKFEGTHPASIYIVLVSLLLTVFTVLVFPLLTLNLNASWVISKKRLMHSR